MREHVVPPRDEDQAWHLDQLAFAAMSISNAAHTYAITL
jgi:hypothetical protein